MAEYIDRNALLKDICGNDPSHMEDYYFNAIANAPTADVVEVVRCKDCKYYIPKENLADEYANPIGADGLCDNTDKYTDEDDYCSYGERKEQE